MKRSTVRLILPPMVVGTLVSSYWALAFYAAATTPIWKGPGPRPPDQWEAIDGIRNHGWETLVPILVHDSHPLQSVPVIESLPPMAFLGLLACLYGLGAALVSFILWWLGQQVMKRTKGRSVSLSRTQGSAD